MTRADLIPLLICLALAVAVQSLAPPQLLLPLLLALILIGGMPHGGLDWVLAQSRLGLERRRAKALFAGAYLGLAGAVAGLWWVAPTLALLLFLAYSAVHFGSDWREGPISASASVGLTVLAMPAIGAPQTTAQLFDALGAEGNAVQTALVWSGAIALPVTLWALRRSADALLLLGGFALGAWVLHPLAWFFVYFCAIHGPRHLRTVKRSSEAPDGALWHHWLLPAGAAALVVVCVGLILWPVLEPDTASMTAVFVGFAALTVPHMVLVDAWRGRPVRSGRRRD